ncbi:MAG: hypothetical protein Q4F66_09030 [Clostridium sp.]|nr:hypothetical protein [Clostridium sp.]
MSEVLEYKCPCCGGAIEFNSSIQKMKCPYCDTEFEMETLKSFEEELKKEKSSDMSWDTPTGSEWQDGEQDGMRVYLCESCGGEIVGDENTAATSCPYCGNPVVMTGQVSGNLRPDCIIPFKLDKKQAKKALKNHFMGKKLLPKVFKDENHIDEIQGIYVPFWIFDADSNADVRFKGEMITHWSDSSYNYTKTDYYMVTRSGSMSFEHVPVDGSSKIEDELMESIEPFDFSEAVDFQTAYLSGYLCDKYDVDSEKSINRANERFKASTEEAFRDTTDEYNSVTIENSNIEIENGNVMYVLYPVWILNTNWNKEKYMFAMNGQTGKFVGNLPVDKRAYWSWFAGLTVIIGGLISVLMCLYSYL